MGFFEFIGVVNEVWVAQERPGQASSAGLPLLHRFVAQSRIVNPGRTRGTTYFCTIVYPPPHPLSSPRFQDRVKYRTGCFGRFASTEIEKDDFLANHGCWWSDWCSSWDDLSFRRTTNFQNQFAIITFSRSCKQPHRTYRVFHTGKVWKNREQAGRGIRKKTFIVTMSNIIKHDLHRFTRCKAKNIFLFRFLLRWQWTIYYLLLYLRHMFIPTNHIRLIAIESLNWFSRLNGTFYHYAKVRPKSRWQVHGVHRYDASR